ncbi:MAG: thioredoxin [Leptolyngbya sp. PLA1]|nr:thioredoxin [Leptolyngbya sp. PLA1]
MASRGSRSRGKGVLIVSVLLFVVFGVLARWGESRRKEPLPAFRHATLTEARDAAAASGLPVLVYVSADWCAPCTRLRAEALSDPEISRWIRENTHGVILDATTPNPEAAALRVYTIPTMLVMRDGQIVAKLEGYRDTAAFRQWLTGVTGAVADWKHRNPGAVQPAATQGG